MVAKYGQHFSTKVTPQTEPIPGKSMVQNNQGGFSFAVDDWVRLERFLILGSQGGSYYASEKKLTVENAQAVLNCIKEDIQRVVDKTIEISFSGRAPKNDPAIFVLALVAANCKGELGRYTDAINKVCRTGTHLFQFIEYVRSFRGMGRSLRKMIAHWYNSKDANDLAYQVTKYQQRDGWSHRDILRLCHVQPNDALQNTIFAWIAKKKSADDIMGTEGLEFIVAMENAKKMTDAKDVARLIRDHGLVREHIPTEFLNSVEVWEALLEKMPMTAMVRNLATMTRIGLIAPMSNGTGKVLRELTNIERIKKSRLHPVQILMAMKTYAAGKGDKSKHTWTPVPQVIDALDGAFYHAFQNVEPTGKCWMFGIDVSGSMAAAPCAGTPMSCCEGATAMALAIAHTEANYAICAFNQEMQQLPISVRSRLDDALSHTRCVNFGGTDCSLPMMFAFDNKIPVEVFCVLTDNETAHGYIHPCQALNEYRNRTGIGAKLVVVGMVSNGFTIADPDDAGMLDVVGFDTATPSLISDFAR